MKSTPCTHPWNTHLSVKHLVCLGNDGMLVGWQHPPALGQYSDATGAKQELFTAVWCQAYGVGIIPLKNLPC